VSIIFIPGAIIFVPTRPSVGAIPVLEAILKISPVEISFYKFFHSLAMKQIFKQITLVLFSLSVNDDPSDLNILFPFS
jgi:hypothetical protein